MQIRCLHIVSGAFCAAFFVCSSFGQLRAVRRIFLMRLKAMQLLLYIQSKNPANTQTQHEASNPFHQVDRFLH